MTMSADCGSGRRDLDADDGAEGSAQRRRGQEVGEAVERTLKRSAGEVVAETHARGGW